MKHLIFTTILLLASFICQGQLKPPQQTDTLIIKSVEYNYSEITEENWPCKYILKSATHFEFEDQKFSISKVEDMLGLVTFHLVNNKSETSKLVYRTFDNNIIISYSGYTFSCVLSRTEREIKQETEQVVQQREEVIRKTDLFNTGAPNDKLHGRTVIGALPSPSYNVKETGKVVVKIKVNRAGTVVEAHPGADGTSLIDEAAWEAAQKAAMNTQFNTKADAPEFQYGTITYFFNITY